MKSNNIGYQTINTKPCHADFYQSTSKYQKLDLESKKTDILDVVSFAPFLMWNEHESKYFENVGAINSLAINDNNVYDIQQTCNDDNNYAELMKEAFFSAENMDIIQNMIIKTVFYQSGKKLRINKIKSETLFQVMNHMWTNFCRFLPYDLKEQIRELDRKVTQYLVPKLLNEAEFYFNYLRDSDRTNLPQLARPIMISRGRKQQLPSFYR
ncbi:MAG: hypothetical protein PHU71_07320 [Candidatus Gracilibacteria bacterium]|nr:hypothetical protein [Candidatus Gracilibacteria bacterium]